MSKITEFHKKRRGMLLAMVIIVIVVSSTIISLSLTVVTDSLHVSGKYIKNSNNEIVFLRGVNRDHFHDIPSGAWGDWGSLVTSEAENELDHLKNEWGINCLRLITSIQAWKENTPCIIDGQQSTHRQAIKTIIELCAQRGIYVVYCPWTVATGHVNEGLPFPPYSDDIDVIADEQEFVDYWVEASRELRQYPNVIYEVFNEPCGINGTINDWYSSWTNTINAVRADGDEHIFLVQYHYAPYWAGDDTFDLSWVFDYSFPQTNIVYSTHLYRTYNHLGSDKPVEYETIKQRLVDMRFKDVADSYPLYIGEIGASFWNDQENEALAMASTLQVFNEWGISYTGWDFWDGREFALVEYKSVAVGSSSKPTLGGEVLINAIAESSNYSFIDDDVNNVVSNITENTNDPVDTVNENEEPVEEFRIPILSDIIDIIIGFIKMLLGE